MPNRLIVDFAEGQGGGGGCGDWCNDGGFGGGEGGGWGGNGGYCDHGWGDGCNGYGGESTQSPEEGALCLLD